MVGAQHGRRRRSSGILRPIGSVTAVSTPLAVAYAVALFALVLTPGAITLLKGQRVLFLAGLAFGGLVWAITALRLARPDSWWARRFYDADKIQRALQRYGPR